MTRPRHAAPGVTTRFTNAGGGTRRRSHGKYCQNERRGDVMTTLEFHPLANVFPLLEGEEFDALVADIQASGLCEPVWLYEGQILDGRNRYRACQVLGLDCATRDYLGNDPLAFVLSMNLQRRHLDESQRAMIAARLATMRQGERTDLVEISTKLSQAQAAGLVGSVRMISRN